MSLHNQELTNKTTLYQTLTTLKDLINYNMNCIKVATVLDFNPDLMQVKCRINNKRLRQLNKQGNQILEDYPDIYAKAHFFGWGDVGAVYPIEPGMEGLLLFNDREIETWYMTSENSQLAYDRCHDLSDALFICGLHSSPKIPLLPFIEECLHIYYKNTDIQIRDKSIKENTTDYEINSTETYKLQTTTKTENATLRNITAPTTNHVGTINSTVLNDLTAATGYIVDSHEKKLAYVVNGIVREIYP